MDDAELRRRARERMEAGTLPSNRPLRRIRDMGTGEHCDLCDLPIQRIEVEELVEIREGQVLRVVRFHLRCASVWTIERAQERGE